jgi:hypothetical protein
MESIITISNLSTGQFFFTTDHCQNHGLGPNWVPCTATLPMHVVPRPCVPDGVVRTKEDYVNGEQEQKTFTKDSWPSAILSMNLSIYHQHCGWE